MNKLGNKISSIRKSRGLSQEKLAEDAGINIKTLQRIEQGITTPHGETLKRLARALDIEIKDIAEPSHKKKYRVLIALNIIVLAVICVVVLLKYEQTDNENSTVITKRIQYYVPISSEDADYYWWNENIEVSNRIPFLNKLFEKALSGEVMTCDPYFNPTTPDQLSALLTASTTVTIDGRNQGREDYDTIVQYEIEPAHIDILKFQEEWRYNEDNLVMEKRVLGICLMRRRSINGGFAREPIFWIYFDDKLLREDILSINLLQDE